MISMTPSLTHEDARPAAVMDERVFHSLYERTARPLRAYLIRCLGNLALADDLLQETYLLYLRAGFSGENEEHRRNYLFRIATNLVKDHFRHRRRERDSLPEKSRAPDPMEGVQLRSDICTAINELSPRDRQMLWLAYVEGANHREIATALGLRTASIKSMLYRARSRLATQLTKRGLHPREELS